MLIPRTSLRWALLTCLWILVGLSGLLLCVQILMVPLSPRGSWHLPRIYRVTIKDFDTDPQSPYATILIAGGEDAKPTPGDKETDAPAEAEPSADAQLKAELNNDPDDEEAGPSIALEKSERRGLSLGEVIWVMDNYHRTPFRPPQFRLSAVRLLLEFPEPVVVLALLLILGLRKRQARRIQREVESPRERTVLKDDFHARAERFADPKEPQP